MKRLFDILFASLALVVFSPVILLVWLLVLKNLGSPAIFAQLRPGRGGRPFNIYKFRTMRLQSDNAEKPLPDAERLTRFGMLLRSTSLDELPELWNVVIGDMSIVGPRPLLMEYLPLYTKKQSRRHDVRPGFTGWAQINGRNRLSWEEKFRLDLWYVENHTFWLDLKIIFLSMFKILKREGISADGSVTTERYKG